MAAPAGKRDAAGQEARQPRCIVWLAPHRPTPRGLLHGLARRGVEAVRAQDPASVMRLLAAEAALAVIVAEPQEQPRAEELCAAVRRYHPDTRLWRYEHEGDAGRPRLEAMDEASAGAPPGAEARHSTNTPATAPPGKPTTNGAHAQPPPPLSSLTAEELEMLLGDAPDQRGGRE